MVCGTCQHDNQPNAKFCSECGAPLTRSCPSCGQQQPAAAKFCDECGTALTAATPAEPAPAPAARKRVTALFADLVGSTTFAERLDAEAVRAGLAPYFEMLQSTVDDHAGTVVKFLGDGMLALFGVPEIAEDDALRAVTAAAELQRRFRSFADEIRERHGVDLGLRVGVNTGELVVGADDVDLVGDVLNTAARLEAACQPGRVLVGGDTWRLTRSSVSYTALGEVRVKGKADALATYQVVEDDAAGVDTVTPFVGRARELDSLREVFDDAVASAHARLVTVIGDPGVGKTRLAHELRTGSNAMFFDLRLERRGSTTFSPIADLVREVTGAESAGNLDRLVDGHPEASRLGAVLASFLGHGELPSTEESFWAVRRLLELLAADGPLIVVVDDIQWAEPLFWDLVDHLVEWTAAPVLLVALARPELRELRPELAQPGRRVSTALALEGLDPDTTLELAARLLEIDELPSELAERLPQSTDGNPLFVRELVQMLVDDGVLSRDGDRWRLTIDADAIEVPPTILSLLASRVERLPDDEREVVELASVIDTEFDLGTLGAIAPERSVARLGAVIDRLRRKDLIEPTGQWAGDDPVYRFHHVLIRDAAYRRLLKGHRADLHERIGRHVDTTGINNDERDVIVAHHFEQVVRYRTELGAVDDKTRELAVEAAERLRSTAEQALDREDLASAGAAAIRALGLLDAAAGAQRDELLLVGCEALLSSADVTRGAPLVDELHTCSTDSRLAAWADCFRAQLWSLTAADRLTEAADLAADAADRLGALGDDAGVAKARLVRASCLARLGRVGDCESELDLALGAARAAGDRRRTVAVLGAAPLAALWGPSTVARAGGRCLDVLRLLRITTASPTVEATSIRCQGMLEALRGRDDAARDKFEISRSIARELGLRHALYETELFAGLAELLGGDAAAAEPHLRAAREGLGRLGIGADAGQGAALLARSMLLQGRTTEADELATNALDTAGQNLQTAIAARAVLAEVRSAQGRHEDAQALVDEALSIVAPTDVTLDHALTLLAAAGVAAAAGNHVEASRRQTGADELLAAKEVTLCLGKPTETAPAVLQQRNAGARPEHFGPLVWNRALELAQRSADLLLAGDLEACAACYATDLALTGHGELDDDPGVQPHAGSSWYVELVSWMLSLAPGRIATVEPLAARGEHHALYRSQLGSDAGTLERLVVVRDDGQVIVEAHFYEPDQLVEAIDELNRQWVEHDPSAVPTRSSALNSRIAAAMASGDPEAMRAAVTEDFVAVDHRRLGLGERDLDEWIASTAALMSGQSMTFIPADVVMGDEQRVLTRFDVYAGETSWHVLNISEVRDGLVSRIEHFDADDLETATARYRELAQNDNRGARFTNTAWEVSKRVDDAFARRDAQAMLDDLAPEFVSVWREQLAGGRVDVPRETFVDVVLHVDGGAAVIDRTTKALALRGDHLVLTWNSTDHEGTVHVRYAVIQCNGRQLTRVDWFDEDQFDEAVTELDRRWLSTCGVPPDSLVVRAWPVTRSTRAGDVADFVHPEFEYTDHCRLRMDELGGDLNEFVRRGWVEPETWTLVTNIHRFDESGAVYERVEFNDGNELWLVWVAQQADGAMRRLDRFDLDDLDAAIALFDSRRPAADTADERALTNTAWEISRHPDDADDASAVVGGTTKLVAVRGDHFALIESSTDHDGAIHARYAVIESDDDRLINIDWFAHEQLRTAQLELDRRWMSSLGFDDRDFIVRHWDLAYNNDVSPVDGLLHPDFEWVDHRPLHYPSGDGAVMTDNMATLTHEIESVIPRIHRISRSAVAVERIDRAAGEAFGEEHQILVEAIADHAMRSIDAYTVEDLPAALTRYNEIVRAQIPAAPRRVEANRAYRIADELARDDDVGSEVRAVVMTRGDRLFLSTSTIVTGGGDEVRRFVVGEADADRLASLASFDESELAEAVAELDRRYRLACGIDDEHWVARNWDTLTSFDADRYDEILAPDFHAVDHRAFTLGLTSRADFLAWVRATPASSTWSIPVIHRLDGRAMVLEHTETWADDSGEGRMLAVIEFGDGRTQRIDTYDADELEAALARYDELTGVSRPALTNAAWESARERVGEGAGSEMELIAIRGDDLCLYRVGTVSPDGDLTEQLVVDVVHDGRCTHTDVFAHNQLVDAQIELDRRYRRSCGIADDHWLAAAASTPYTTDFADLGWFLHSDFEFVERRPLAWPSGDADNLREYMETYASEPEIVVPIVHRLSERGYVYERLERTDDGAVTYVIMVCHFQEERLRRLVVYEPHDLDRALAEFDAFVEQRGSGWALTNRAWEVTSEVAAVFPTGDRAALERLIDPAGAVENRGRLSLGTGNGRVFLDLTLESLAEAREYHHHFDVVAVRGDHLCLVKIDGWYDDANLANCLVVETDDERVTHMVWFDEAQLLDAQLELDRRWLASIGQSNHWIAPHWAIAYDPHPDAMFELLTPDFEIVDHRPLMFPSGDAEVMRSTIESMEHDVVFTIPRIHRFSEIGSVFERVERAVDEIGEHHIVFVTRFDGESIRSVDAYHLADLDQALARYDEFAAD